MATVVNMPKLGFDMAEGVLVRWVVAEGEGVEKGEVLAEIETDKATIEVEAELGGVVLKHLVTENTNVPVGAPIAAIGEAGEDFDSEAVPVAEPTPAVETEGIPESAAPSRAEGIGVAEPSTDGDGRLPGGVRASPVARRLAKKRGVRLSSISGSGPDGRIVKSDVEAALSGAVPVVGAVAAPTLPELQAAAETVRTPVSKLRGLIGKRMTAAKQQLPHFYVTADLEAGPLMEQRRQLNSRMPEDAQFSVNDFLVKASAMALREFPNLNASLDGEEIVRHGHINIGVAVAVDDGLLTVVAKDVDLKPIRQLSAELRELVSHAREGRVRPGDIEGSTFTVSNLGMYQVDHFIAIINPPEAAILAVGSVRDEAVVVDGQVVPGKRLQVTLSADHRVTDGAEVARWLQVFREYVENPVHTLI